MRIRLLSAKMLNNGDLRRVGLFWALVLFLFLLWQGLRELLEKGV